MTSTADMPLAGLHRWRGEDSAHSQVSGAARVPGSTQGPENKSSRGAEAWWGRRCPGATGGPRAGHPLLLTTGGGGRPLPVPPGCQAPGKQLHLTGGKTGSARRPPILRPGGAKPVPEASEPCPPSSDLLPPGLRSPRWVCGAVLLLSRDKPRQDGPPQVRLRSGGDPSLSASAPGSTSQHVAQALEMSQLSCWRGTTSSATTTLRPASCWALAGCWVGNQALCWAGAGAGRAGSGYGSEGTLDEDRQLRCGKRSWTGHGTGPVALLRGGCLRPRRAGCKGQLHRGCREGEGRW